MKHGKMKACRGIVALGVVAAWSGGALAAPPTAPKPLDARLAAGTGFAELKGSVKGNAADTGAAWPRPARPWALT